MYSYRAGHLPALTRDIDQLLQDQSGFNPETVAQLHAKHFKLDKLGEAVMETSQDLHGTIELLLQKLGESQDEGSKYCTALDGVAGRLDNAGESEGMEALVQDVLRATQQIAERNKLLNGQVEEASTTIERLQGNLESAKREATTDGLTGIANRKQFDIVLHDEAERSAKNGSPLSLMLADVDHFKKFNDNFGHRVGDEVLKSVAGIISRGIGPGGTAARYGGEEFAVILPETTVDIAREAAEEIRIALASKELTHRKTGQSYGRITLSIGLAGIKSDEPICGFLERADKALYQAKRDGRNRVQVDGDNA